MLAAQVECWELKLIFGGIEHHKFQGQYTNTFIFLSWNDLYTSLYFTLI